MYFLRWGVLVVLDAEGLVSSEHGEQVGWLRKVGLQTKFGAATRPTNNSKPSRTPSCQYNKAPAPRSYHLQPIPTMQHCKWHPHFPTPITIFSYDNCLAAARRTLLAVRWRWLSVVPRYKTKTKPKVYRGTLYFCLYLRPGFAPGPGTFLFCTGVHF